MKHLKRFNESKEEEFDVEYIRHCFVDIIDEFNLKIEDKSFKEYDMTDKVHTEVPCLQIVIDLPRLNGRIAFVGEEISDIQKQ